MAGFDDLVTEAMPYLVSEEIAGSTGSTWEWSYRVLDSNSDPVDFAGVTGVCELRRTLSDEPAISPTVSFPEVGVVQVSASEGQTASLAPGRYLHEVELTDDQGRRVKVCGAGDSYFVVKQGVTV